MGITLQIETCCDTRFERAGDRGKNRTRGERVQVIAKMSCVFFEFSPKLASDASPPPMDIDQCFEEFDAPTLAHPY